jgi:hypothetical protein
MASAPIVVQPPQSVQMLPNEARIIAVEFASYGLASGETLAGPAVAALTLNGAAHGGEVVVGATSISGTQVLFRVAWTAAPAGNIYRVDVTCPTSIAGNVAEGAFTITIIPIG